MISDVKKDKRKQVHLSLDDLCFTQNREIIYLHIMRSTDPLSTEKRAQIKLIIVF